ncbi:MAG: 5-formyltetrahydrofolate cyclo-ligase [Hyphomicrobiaceae bacterium]
MGYDRKENLRAKSDLRLIARQKRNRIDPIKRRASSLALCGAISDLRALLDSNAVISAYRPIGSELDPTPLVVELAADDLRIGLPVMQQVGKPLLFRQWREGDQLEKQLWGIEEPQDGAPVTVPDLLLIPLLAYDRYGWRLGYGGGFYDRTLSDLRSKKKVQAVGIAFVEQEVDSVPYSANDQRLDWMLTPQGLRHTEDAIGKTN